MSLSDKMNTWLLNTFQDLRRFDIKMNNELAKDFNELSYETGVSRGEVFRRAIALYKRCTSAIQNGGTIFVQDKNGKMIELVGLINEQT